MWLVNDSTELVEKGAHLELPFTLKLHNTSLPITAQKTLRFVPGTRITVLARWGARQVVAKIFFHPKRSRQHFHRELDGLKSYEKSKISSPAILYGGDSEASRIQVIILEYLADASPLQALYEKKSTSLEKLALLLPAVHCLAQLHNHGFYHNDLHFNNFLMVSSHCIMMDGDGIKPITENAPLGLNLSLKNIAQLFAQLPLKDHHLFSEAYTTYGKHRQWDQPHHMSKDFLREVDNAIKKRMTRHRKKIMRNCSAIQCKKQWHWYITWHREYASAAFFHALATLDRLMESKKSQYLKKGNTCTVAKVHRDEGSWLIKRFNIKNWRHGLKRAFSRSRASKCWRNAHVMALLGISVQKPIAFLERRWGPFRRQAYYVSEYMEGKDLLTYAQEHLHHEETLHALCEALQSLLSQLHLGKITHGDMKATNFIVNEEGYITLIDLDAVVFHKNDKCFQRLWKKDMNRFMKNWETTPSLKVLFEKVIK